jgi:hypothetical protein
MLPSASHLKLNFIVKSGHTRIVNVSANFALTGVKYSLFASCLLSVEKA